MQDATAALFGLSVNDVPNDVLRWVGKYNQHWWARVGATAAYYTLETETNHIAANADNYYTYYYADSVIVSENGTVALAEPISTVSLARKASKSPASAWAVLTGKFYYGGSSDSIRYMANTPYKPGGESYIYVIDQEVTGHPQTSDGETVYITSNDRNAYPDNGTVDGLIYQYLGVPFKNLPTAAKIETGSYVGTGKYGKNNKNMLTFGFVPKLFVIDGADRVVVLSGIASYGASALTSISLIWKGTTVSWYASQASYQFNTSGYTYNYLAIG